MSMFSGVRMRALIACSISLVMRALLRIAESFQHFHAASGDGPRGQKECAQSGLAREVWVDIRHGFHTSCRRGAHHGHCCSPASLLAALHFDVCQHRHESRFFGDLNGLLHSSKAAVVRFRGEPVMIGKIRSPRGSGFHHRDRLFRAREIAGLVVEAGRYSPCALLEIGSEQGTHPLDFGSGGAAVFLTHDRGPYDIEADVGSHVHGHARGAESLHLHGEVSTTGAIGVGDLRGDTLGQHIHRSGHACRAHVAVEVDKSRRHDQSFDIEVDGSLLAGQVADAMDESVTDGDIRTIQLRAGPIDHSAVSQEDIVGLGGDY